MRLYCRTADHGGTHGQRARHGAAEGRTTSPTSARGRGPRFTALQDQHGDPRRPGDVYSPASPADHTTDGARPWRSWTPSTADRHLPPAVGPKSGSASTSTTTCRSTEGCRWRIAQAARASRHAVQGVRQTGIPRSLLQISNRPPRRLASLREPGVWCGSTGSFLEKHAVDVGDHRRAVDGLLGNRYRSGRLAEACEINIGPTTTTATWRGPSLAASLRRAAQRAHHGDRHRRRCRGRARW